MESITKDRIKKAGWYPERQIDVKSIQELYEQRGFVVIDTVKDFLVQYGMLKMSFPKKGSPFNTIEEVDFDPFLALGKSLHKDCFEVIEEEFPEVLEVQEEEFYPIGNMARGNIILFLTDKGKFFGHTDGCLIKAGDTVDEMLDCIVGQCKIPFIYD